MKEALVAAEVGSVTPLRCPQCGNDGSWAAFNARTFVLIGVQGRPTTVGDYSEWVNEDGTSVNIDCHDCDYIGSIDEFEERTL